MNLRLIVAVGVLLSNGASWAGGVSDGGGNLVDEPAAGPESVASVIQHSRKDLRLYIRALKLRFDSTTATPMDMKMFGDPSYDLTQVIEDIPVEIRADRACEFEGLPVDGSAKTGEGPKNICISTQRIGAKLVSERVYVETLALMLHEYSHILGATESEATQLQRRALRDLRSSSMALTDHVGMTVRDSGGTALMAKVLPSYIQKLDVTHVDTWWCGAAGLLIDASYRWHRNANPFMNHPLFAYLTKAEQDEVAWNFARQRLTANYILGRLADENMDCGAETWGVHNTLAQYNALFDSSPSIQYSHYQSLSNNLIGEGPLSLLAVTSGNTPSLYNEVPLYRLTSLAEARLTLLSLADYWSRLYSYFHEISANLDFAQ